MEDNKTPAGSEPIAPLPVDNQAPAPTPEPAPAPVEDKPAAKSDDSSAKIEAMLKASQSMIGKQSSEIGALRAKLDELSKPQQGPSEDQQLADLYQKMDSGELDIAQGIPQILALNSNLTAAKVMAQVQAQQQQGKIAEVQGKFLKDNPEYEQVVSSGELQPYLDADPLADEYTAFHKWKADQKVSALQKEAEAKIAAAKEEGARLAKGAEAAGKVLGRQAGSAAAPPQPTGPRNAQQQRDAMAARLAALRANATQ